MAKRLAAILLALSAPAFAHGPADQADIFRSALAHFGVSCIGHDIALAKAAADGIAVTRAWAAVDALAQETGTLATQLRRQTEDHAATYQRALVDEDAETLARATRDCGEIALLRQAIADEARDHGGGR